MSGDIDPVSAALGRLEAMALEGVRHRDEMKETVQGMSACLTKMSSKIDSLGARIETAAKTADEAHKLGSDWKATKLRAVAWVLGLGGGAGLGGTVLGEWLKKLAGLQ